MDHASTRGADTVMELYDYMHADHGKKASDIKDAERQSKGDEAVRLAIEMQRAILALIGSHKRRTYAHHIVYGIRKLHVELGRPWAAATESSEHLHQDIKKSFRHMR